MPEIFSHYFLTGSRIPNTLLRFRHDGKSTSWKGHWAISGLKESSPFLQFWDIYSTLQFSSVTQSCSTLNEAMDCSRPGFPVHHQLPELAQNSCPSSQWCHLTISSFGVPFSSCFQSFPSIRIFSSESILCVR